MSIRPKQRGAPISQVRTSTSDPSCLLRCQRDPAGCHQVMPSRPAEDFRGVANRQPRGWNKWKSETKSFPSWVQPVFWMWSWTRLASKVLIHAEECVGQIGGKASACMAIAMFVGWSSIACLVVGIVIFVSTIWHLFCLLVEEILYTEILLPTHPRFTFLLGRGLFSGGNCKF